MSEVSGRYPKFGVVMPDRTILQYRPFLGVTLDCDPLNVKLVFWIDESISFCVQFAQDIAISGAQQGLDGKRSPLVSHIFRLVDSTRVCPAVYPVYSSIPLRS